MAFPEWFVGPPVVGGPNQYQVVQASNQTAANRLKSEGYKGPYATDAAATAAASAATKRATSTEVPTQAPSSSGCSDNCLLGNWNLHLFTLPCLITKPNARAIIGGLVLGAAGVTGIVGVLLMAKYGLENTQAGQALTKSAATAAKAGAFVGLGA